jgi:Peptidase A4 family
MFLKFLAPLPKSSLVRLRLPLALIATSVAALGGAASALADNSTSSNWSGYAVHRSGVRFSQVSGTWRTPSATCEQRQETYSANWVGLGGYSPTSQALEQIGTETDCTPGGSVVTSAWYELVPAPSVTINLRVHPGDLMSASVSVAGQKVTMKLSDLTRHRSFSKRLNAALVDLTSAEWIVEAPSACYSSNDCQTLPLANFGTTNFSSSSARTTSGRTGSIGDHSWQATKITLSPGGRRFIVYQGSGPSAGGAQPSSLSPGGSAFSVKYTRVSVQASPFFSRRRAGLGAARLVHPTR